MAPKLVPLDEAAKRLGVSPDELTQLRSAGKIFGYRDGSSWKFKEDEIERYLREQSEMAGGSGPIDMGGGREESDINELVAPDDADNILVSEETEGASPGNTGSTVIGGEKKPKAGAGESDVQLAAGSGIGGSDVELVAGNSDVLGGSKASRVGSDKDLAPLDLGQSDLKLGDELTLGGDLDLGRDSDVGLGQEKKGSGGSSALDLDDEMALGRGSGKGSDVTLGASDSGINLKKPNESGLALDVAPLELAGGSHVDSSLELGEDNDRVELEAEADPEMATQLKADDDFLLTPVEEQGQQESDSGSQVIALDTDEFDQTSPTMLGATDLAAPLLEAEEQRPMEGVGVLDAGMTQTAGSPLMAPVMGGELPETPYTIWNVLSLFAVTLCMAFVGMLMVDLMRNMWSWDGTTNLNSAMMDKIIEMVDSK